MNTKDLPKTPDNRKSIVDQALELGKPVFPVDKSKRPAFSNADIGVERGKGGLNAASDDPDRIEELFTDKRWAHRITGIGMPTGEASGCTVIDVDCGKGKKHRAEATRWLEANRKTALWGAAVVRTGSGGLHYYCKYTPLVKTGASVYADGVDIRNDGGYVVIPPFMGYTWERVTPDDDRPSAPPVPENRKRGEIIAPENSAVVPPQIIEMARLIRENVTWHEPVRDIVAHLVGSGWNDAEILRYSFQWTTAGHTPRDTFEDLCVMIAGARQKWDATRKEEERRANAVEAIKNGLPKLTLEQRQALHAKLGDMI